MKQILKYSLLAFAIVTLFSCAKEELENVDNPEEVTVQLITASFSKNEESTKTTLSGLTPVWSNGDEIKLYDIKGTERQKLTLSNTEGPSSTIGKISKDGLSFTFAKPTSFGDEIGAIYPYSCGADNLSKNNNMVFEIPTETTGSFAQANICGAKVNLNESKNLSFKNLTPIVKISDKTQQISKITLQGNHLEGNQHILISASYEITDLTSTNATVAYNQGKTDLITITPGSLEGPFYAAVAPVIVESQLASYWEGDHIVGQKTLSTQVQFNVNKIYNIGSASQCGIGVFSVSAGRKVQFAPGNLYCDGYDFYFEDHQWDYRTTYSSTNIGHFYWSQASANSIAPNYSPSSVQSNYFFTNYNDSPYDPQPGLTIDDQKGMWRMLLGGTGEEWNYLLTSRVVNGGTGENYSYKRAYLVIPNQSPLYGLIIAPDNSYQDLSKMGSSITLENFQYLERSGFVFLPAAGYRSNGTGVYSCRESGMYWTATPSSTDANTAYHIGFNTSYIDSDPALYNRTFGSCLRLVRNLNN